MLSRADLIPAPQPRLVIFGDSHYACVRMAHQQRLASLDGLSVEYWGHVGKRFRFLDYRDDAIVPIDDYTAERFAKFNEKGRRSLPVADFDAVAFVGCRFYVTPLFFQLAQAQADGQFVTSGLRARLVRDLLDNSSTYDYARRFAATAKARILFSPVSLPTAGLTHGWEAAFPAATALDADTAADLWRRLARAMAEEGVRLIAQPESSRAGGLWTRPEYAADGHQTSGDAEHKNPAYGALVLGAVLDQLADLRPALAKA